MSDPRTLTSDVASHTATEGSEVVKHASDPDSATESQQQGSSSQPFDEQDQAGYADDATPAQQSEVPSSPQTQSASPVPTQTVFHRSISTQTPTHVPVAPQVQSQQSDSRTTPVPRRPDTRYTRGMGRRRPRHPGPLPPPFQHMPVFRPQMPFVGGTLAGGEFNAPMSINNLNILYRGSVLQPAPQGDLNLHPFAQLQSQHMQDSQIPFNPTPAPMYPVPNQQFVPYPGGQHQPVPHQRTGTPVSPGYQESAPRQPKSPGSPLNPPQSRGPPRKPIQSGLALWIGNLPKGSDVETLKERFARDGIRSVFLMGPSCCAFVNYENEEKTLEALAEFQDTGLFPHGVR
jgi:hypothetical protein